MKLNPGNSFRLLIGSALALASSMAIAQAWPNKPIRLVVPYGTGGAPDVIARTLSPRLGEIFSQQVLVDNRPGAGGAIAAEHVAKSPADGYTFFVADTGHFAINPALYSKLPYDILRDFTPVIHIASTPLFLAVGAAVPAKNIQELIALAKDKPGGLSYGSSGNGSPHHLALAQITALTRANFVHIPFKGVAQSVPAVLSGDVAVIFVGLPSILPHVKSGKARIVAVNEPKRTHLMPEVPTVVESGVPDFTVSVSIGFLAPAGTPSEPITRMNAEVNKLINLPDLIQRFTSLGIDKIGGTPEQFGQAIRADLPRFAKVVKETGAKVD